MKFAARPSVVLALVTACAAAPASAQLWVPDKGAGAVALSYQHVVDHTHLDGNGNEFSPGIMEADTLLLRVDYGLTDRLAVHVAAPLSRKRYIGPGPHNPDPFNNDDDHDHEHVERLDDGEWHGGWQDPAIGVRWRWKDRLWRVTPFATYSWPSHDYTYFAHAAIGTRQKRLALGVAAGRQFGPSLPKLYFTGTYSYTFIEEVLDVSVDYSNLNLELGWFFTPRLSARAMLMLRKTHGGLDIPTDFPDRTSELFLHHDQIQRVDYVNWGVGASWSFAERWNLSATWYTTGWGENGHKIHNAVGIGVSRTFD